VAMQFEISDEAAITFAGEFYSALAEGVPVDAAVAEARKAIYATNDVEWATPVLYMRSPNGVLFKLAAPKDPAQRTRELERQRTEQAAKEEQQRAEQAEEEARREREAQLAAERTREEEEQREREKEEQRAREEAEQREREAEEQRTGELERQRAEDVAKELAKELAEEQRRLEHERSIGARAARRQKAEAEARLKRERGEAAEAAKQSSKPVVAEPVTTPDEPETPGITRTAWLIVGGIIGIFILVLVLASQGGGGYDSPPPPSSVYPVTLSVSPATVSVAVGDTIHLTVSATNSDGSTSTPYPNWTSSDTTVASVSYGGEVRGVAPGKAVITATSGASGQAEVTVVTAYDIPSLRAMAGPIHLFESGAGDVEKPARVYLTTFDPETTRYINIELELKYAAPTAALQEKIPCTFYDAGGAAVGRPTVYAYVVPGEFVGWPTGGWGSREATHWDPGTYRVSCRFDGKTIARSSFSVSDVPSYDIVVLKARVTAFRFFEGTNDTETPNYSRRFDHQTARYIYAELALAFPAQQHVVDASVACTYYKNGTQWWSSGPQSFKIPASWTTALESVGAGWVSPGNWPTGTYRVKCTSDGRVIAEDTFDVY
jgi:hypothetical protein